MSASKLRLILSAELIAYFFAAPYIILLGLDEKRGLFDSLTSMNMRLWGYALLVGIYPFLQIIVSPYVGRRLDKRHSKISVLRNIHLANFTCYLLLAFAAYKHSLVLALLGLSIPGVVGCASPVGKSLIASLTEPSSRVKEFAKVAFLRGVVKLVAPLIGAYLFESIFYEIGYAPLFIISSFFSLFCFVYTFTFGPSTVCAKTESEKTKAEKTMLPATLRLFRSIIQNNAPLLLVFVFLLIGYSVFVKYTPLVMFQQLGENPSYVNYFVSLVGLSYSLNQFILVRYAKQVEGMLGVIFTFLCSCLFLLAFSGSSLLWFCSLFAILFCFSSLTTCIEARVSLHGVTGTQGTVQGILYSIENKSYLLAPVIGAALATQNMLYPLYFVAFCAGLSGLAFVYSQRATYLQKQER
jgi:MFS family permease